MPVKQIAEESSVVSSVTVEPSVGSVALNTSSYSSIDNFVRFANRALW